MRNPDLRSHNCRGWRCWAPSRRLGHGQAGRHTQCCYWAAISTHCPFLPGGCKGPIFWGEAPQGSSPPVTTDMQTLPIQTGAAKEGSEWGGSAAAVARGYKLLLQQESSERHWFQIFLFHLPLRLQPKAFAGYCSTLSGSLPIYVHC